MVTQKLETTTTEQLENQLKPFVTECERRGYPISNLCVHESIPGVYNSFYLTMIADWVRDTGRVDAILLLFGILRESTPQDVNQFIHGVVTDYSQDMLETIDVLSNG
ncbi:MAG: hypothetical protein LBU65_03440 [Planctomycetaceae bacterium]|nr:hypothetical protein [Planctomycetaceae bacterium]